MIYLDCSLAGPQMRNGGAVLHGSRRGCGDPVSLTISSSFIRCYGPAAMRISGNQQWLTSDVIACRADNYGSIGNHREQRAVNPLVARTGARN